METSDGYVATDEGRSGVDASRRWATASTGRVNEITQLDKRHDGDRWAVASKMRGDEYDGLMDLGCTLEYCRAVKFSNTRV
ncbi:hypothetical protein HN51_002544 [Arachis hypogaea]